MDKKKHTKILNTIYIRFLSTMLIILVVPFCILGVIYTLTKDRINELAYENTCSLLETGAQNVEQIFERMDNMITYFYQNQNITNFYYYSDVQQNGSTTSYLLNAQKNLSAMSIANSDILNIQMYASKSDALIDFQTCSIYPYRYYNHSFHVLEKTYEEWRNEDLLCKEPVCYYAQTIQFKGAALDVLVYNRSFSKFRYGQGNNRILFYLNSDLVLQYFTASGWEEGGMLSLYGPDEKLLLYRNTMNPQMEESLPFSVDTKSGYRIVEMDGKKTFVTWYCQKERCWTYYVAVPLERVTSVTSGFRLSLITLLVMALVVAILLVILLAGRLARPISQAWSLLLEDDSDLPFEEFSGQIKKLVAHNEELLEQSRQQMNSLRTAAMNQLLLGKTNSEEECRDLLMRIQIPQEARHYVILIVVCNELPWDMDLEEISAQKLFVEHAFCSLDQLNIQDIYQVDLEKMVILIPTDEPSYKAVKDRTEAGVQKALDIVKQNNHFSVSVGGDIVNHASLLSTGFYHAGNALNIKKNVFASRAVQWFDEVEMHREEVKDVWELTEEEHALSGNNELADQIQSYINANYQDSQISLAMVADEFHITEVYLSKLFKKATGQNFSKYLEQIRMVKAKDYIEKGDSISEAAEKVGYHSAQVFRRAWKRYYGGKPSDITNE